MFLFEYWRNNIIYLNFIGKICQIPPPKSKIQSKQQPATTNTMTSLSAAAAVLSRTSSLISRTSVIPSISTILSRPEVNNSRSQLPSLTNFHRPKFTGLSYRSLSTLPPTNGTPTLPSPTSLSAEAGLKAQDAMRLFIEHGIGKRALDGIAEDKRKVSTILHTVHPIRYTSP